MFRFGLKKKIIKRDESPACTQFDHDNYFQKYAHLHWESCLLQGRELKSGPFIGRKEETPHKTWLQTSSLHKDSFDARGKRVVKHSSSREWAHSRVSEWVSDKQPGFRRPPPHRDRQSNRQTGCLETRWLPLNCVTFIDESAARCCRHRRGALSRGQQGWNAPFEEDADGQPGSAAGRPVSRHGMPDPREQPQRERGCGRQV